MSSKEVSDRLDELRAKGREHAQNRDWGLHRNSRYEVADLLRKEGESESSLAVFLEVAILDINEPNNLGGTPEHLIDTELDSGVRIADFTPSESIGLPPAVAQYILRLKDELGLTEIQLKHRYGDIVEERWRRELELTPEETWERIEQELSESE